ncbi:hypothetical protein IID22_02445 [Patescibacteria group bacterium]|nr:hypothetical protein [Patescibacteria group bacterium]
MAGKQLPHDDLVRTGLPKKGEKLSSDNQVRIDFQKAKEVKNKLLGTVGESVSPIITKQGKKFSGLTAPLGGLFSPDLIKKLLRIGTIAVLLVVLFYIGSQILRTLTQDGENGQIVVTTPSVAPFHPLNPSIYADDEQVLQMEEDVKVLDRELSTTQLKETILTPPVLDFDIDFEQ